MVPASAHFPDTLVGLLPILTQPIETAPNAYPAVIAEGHNIFVVQVEGIEELPENIQLELAIGTVADSHGPGATIAVQVIEGLLREIVPAVDAVNDLQCGAGINLSGTRLQPSHEFVGFLRESDPEQPVQREGGVADPGVAIVPISAPAEQLWQTACRRRDHGAGRFEGHEL